jgi:hypothetical protein
MRVEAMTRPADPAEIERWRIIGRDRAAEAGSSRAPFGGR